MAVDVGKPGPTAEDRAAVRRRKQQTVMEPLPIERIDASSLTDESFFQDYVLANKPCVIRGAIDHWPALAKWSRKYFEENFADKDVKASPLPPSGANVWFEDVKEWKEEGVPELPGVRLPDRLLVVSGVREGLKFGDLLERLKNKPQEGETLWYADGGGNLEKDFAFLQDDISLPKLPPILNVRNRALWLGCHSLTKMHYDNFDNLYAQVHLSFIL